MLDAGFGNNIAIGQRRYLGSKTKLLSFIDEILIKEDVQYNSFADLFAGTGVVADYFFAKSNVIINDILESNFICYQAYFGQESIRQDWLNKKIDIYNCLEANKLPANYFSKNFANTYFDLNNSKLIGYIREDTEQLFSQQLINLRERAYLITSLMYALDRIAHTVGHYDAYRKVAHIGRRLQLRPLLLQERKFSAEIYKQDANQFISKISPDVIYIDPPYNSRQYSDAYHLLENIATWQKGPVAGVAKKIDRTHIKSQYSLKSASSAFSDLINQAQAKYILVSYNDMGTNGDPRSQARISDHELLSALQQKGDVKIYEKPFNQFTTGKSYHNDLKERIFFCKVRQSVTKRPVLVKSNRNNHMPEHVKSPLNYTGGKHKLLPQLSKYWPDSIDTFYDVFCGGANVAINAKANRIVAIDNNEKVIDLLRLIQSTNFADLNQALVSFIEKYGLSQSYIKGYDHYGSESSSGLGQYNKDRYLALRKDYNSAKDNSEKTRLLLLLVLYGFNNQIRFNSRGEFNLPVGKRDYNGSSRRNLIHFNAITNAKKVRFIKKDFRDLRNLKITKHDFVYLDPPYLLGLASYNENGGWSINDERDLYAVLVALHKKGVRFALSNVMEHKGKTNEGLLNWTLSNDFYINHISHHYKNSNYQSKAKTNNTQEVLITNYNPATI